MEEAKELKQLKQSFQIGREIINPQKTIQLLQNNNHPHYPQLLTELINLLQNELNAALLHTYSQSPSFLETLIALLLQDNINNEVIKIQKIQNKYWVILQLATREIGFKKRNLTFFRRKLQEMYYQQNITNKKISNAIQILKNAQQSYSSSDPIQYMFFTGQPLHFESRKILLWPFSKGYTICFHIKVIKTPRNNGPLPIIYTFHTKQSGGLQAFMVDQKIYYRNIPAKYSAPQSCTNSIYLGSIELDKWNYVAIEHEQRRTFMKSKVSIYINDNAGLSINLDPPNIPQTHTRLCFFGNIFCKTSSILLFTHTMGYKVQQFSDILYHNKNIWYQKQVMLIQPRRQKIWERKGLGYCLGGYINRQKPVLIKQVLQLFYLLSKNVQIEFQKKSFFNEQNLNNLLTLIPDVISSNQCQILQRSFFSLISQNIIDYNINKFNQQTIHILNDIYESIEQQRIKEAYFNQMFINFGMYRIMDDRLLVDFVKNLKSMYQKQPTYLGSLFSVSSILDVIIYKFDNQLIQIEKIQQFSNIHTIVDLLFNIIQLFIAKLPCGFVDLSVKSLHLNSSRYFKKKVLKLIYTMLISQKVQYLKQFINEKCHLGIMNYIRKGQWLQNINTLTVIIGQVVKHKIPNINSRDIVQFYSQEYNKKVKEDKEGEFKICTKIFKEEIPILEKEENQEESPPKKGPKKFQLNVAMINQDRAEELNYQNTFLHPPSLINKRKPQKFDFTQLFTKNQSPTEALLPPPIGKNKKKFQFSLSLQSAQQQVKPIGMDFSRNKASLSLQQNQKSDQIYSFKTPIKEKKLNIKKPMLQIDTDQINKMHNYGGQHGNKIIIDQSQIEAQIKQITRLAQICIKFMRQQIREQQEKEEVLQQKEKYEKQQRLKTKSIGKQCLPSSRASKKTFQFGKMNKQKDGLNIISSNIEQQKFLWSIVQKIIECKYKENSKMMIENRKLLPLLFKANFSNACEAKIIRVLTQLSKFQKNLQIITCEQFLRFSFEYVKDSISKILLGNLKNLEVLKELMNLYEKMHQRQFQSNPQTYKLMQKILVWKLQYNLQDQAVNITARLLWHKCFQAINNTIKQNPKKQILVSNIVHIILITEQLVFQKHKKKKNQEKENMQISPVSKWSQNLCFLVDSFKIDNYFTLGKWIDSNIVQQTLQLIKQLDPPILKMIRNLQFNKQQIYFLIIKYLSSGKSQEIINIYQFYMEKQISMYRGNLLKSILRLITTYFDQLINVHGGGNSSLDKLNKCISEICSFSYLILIFAENARCKQIFQNKYNVFAYFLFISSFLQVRAHQSTTQVDKIIQQGLQNIYFFLQQMLLRLQNEGFSCQGYIQQKKHLINPEHTNLLIFQLINQYLLQNDNSVSYQQFGISLNSEKVVGLVYQKFSTGFEPLPLPKSEQSKKQHILNLLKQSQNSNQQFIKKKLQTYIVIQEQGKRIVRYKWKKTWRTINLYHKSLEKFRKAKLAKQQTKSRARVFLKYTLQQPQYVKQYQKNQPKINESLSPILNYQLRKEQFKEQKLLDNSSKLGSLYNFGKNFIKGMIPGRSKTQQSFSFREVQWITTLTLRKGSIVISSSKLIFLFQSLQKLQSHKSMIGYQIPQDHRLLKQWNLENIKYLYRRRYISRHTALQIFFLDGNTLFLNFINRNDCQSFEKTIIKFNKIRCPNLVYNKTLNPKKLFDVSGMHQKWINHQISNFHYLMYLNTLAGRSYKDISQYPVFPWVIKNYKTKQISLLNPNFYRDLSKNMGSLGSTQRIELFKQKFQSPDMYSKSSKFHYGTHYSSPAIVFHFLIRISPFTQGAKALQGGKFDTPDRLFNSISQSYTCSTTQVADIRQIIPQFYCFPEMFINISNIDFGLQQNNQLVNHVKLPEWAHNPFHCVATFKRALESSIVSCTINRWIDLIFGYKQRGKQAQNNLNVFYYLTYEDAIDIDSNDLDINKHATQCQIMNFGQTPSQLFIKAHPSRISVQQTLISRVLTDPKAQIKAYKPSLQTQKAKHRVLNRRISILDIQQKSIIKLKWVYSQKKFICIKRNGIMTEYSFLKDTSPNNKVPFRCCTLKQKQLLTVCKKKYQINCCYDPSLFISQFPIQFIYKGSIIILGGLINGVIQLINTQSDTIVSTLHNHSDTVSQILCDNKENFIFTGDIKGKVILWRIQPQAKLVQFKVFQDHQDQITKIHFSSQLRCFATASFDGTCYIYNCFTGKLMSKIEHPQNLQIDQIILSSSPLPCLVILTYSISKLYVMSLTSKQLQQIAQKQNISTLHLLRDMQFNEWLIYPNDKGKIILREIYSERTRRLNALQEGICVQVISSNDGRYVVAGYREGQIAVLTDPGRLK